MKNTNLNKTELWVADFSKSDNELWDIEVEANSKEEIIKKGTEYIKELEIEEDDDSDYRIFRIGTMHKVDIPTIDYDEIVDTVIDKMYERTELAEDFLSSVTKEQEKELEADINHIFKNWIDNNNLDPGCFVIQDVEEIKVEIEKDK
ncbi:MAG: hypothetical protein N4A54_09600 [Peptostreptococcaceae bacterium]|jgi:hypothetical protein|nr:hypothetical protein [Peptostreptococcaceae bacterium]